VLAETGTLALSTLPGQMRSVSLLPPVHVAVARAEHIVPTMADYLLLLRAAAPDWQQRLTSCISFITGPSRTGDIELKLTVGVHGPGEVYLVLIDEPATSRPVMQG
jgi:L-lactate dehydrogenase complex protein LldG